MNIPLTKSSNLMTLVINKGNNTLAKIIISIRLINVGVKRCKNEIFVFNLLNKVF